ncbi:outer membrane receptor protein involved in Fe transport [Maribacter spongiicola]|uniref:Outer membrane receptor protein involved in Fe transport n=1 Tax=Maribacter spongiicola TaxID=1206753 RepID=A0A4R7K792_9FLAO|nr:outer membrane beta-barrel family protein [Maribacter spongiicola]TDT46278.1 outer membrane receptor protein involved in Fe transport [Maribacter spongiicola]
MTRNLHLTLLFCLTFSLAFAQDFLINGAVIDDNQNPVVLANVILLTGEGEFIKGTVTNDQGLYEFKAVTPGTYNIVASYIANTIESSNISITENTEVKPLILKSSQELDEVVVTQKKPVLEQLADRHIFSVENTALSDGDIWDVLKRTPGVMVMNNRLYINGSPNVNVMINGKLVNLPESDIVNLLTGSSASNVEAIEVITSPPAKYSAEGGLLINIKMKKNLVAGYNGAVFNRYTQGVLPKHTLGTDHFFKGKKIDFSTNYSFSHNRNWTRYTDITTYLENGQENEIWTAEQKIIDKKKSHNINLFLDVQLNEKNTLSITSTSNLSPNGNTDYFSITDINTIDGDLTARLDGLNVQNDDSYNTSNYLDWVYKLNDKGAELTTNAHFTYYDSKQSQVLNNNITQGFTENTSENTLNIGSDQIINLFSAQTDLTLPLTEQSVMETGLRVATINSEASIMQSGFDDSVDGISPTESGLFDYDEQIYAGYVSLNNNWESWKLNVGLRAEYTDTEGNLDMSASLNTTSYFKLFPNMALSYKKEKNAFYLKYYRRITRPRYSSINPFQFYLTANSLYEGNPNLKPAYSDYLQFDYVYDRDYKVVLFVNRKSNEQAQQIIQDNQTNILRTQYINLESNYFYGIDVSVSKELTSYWYLYALVSHYHDKKTFKDLNTNTIVENSIWTTFIRANNYFTLLKDESLFADVTYTYFSPYISGNATSESFSKLGLSFRKTFWNKDASISLGIEDIFNNGNTFSTRNYLDQQNTVSSRVENRLFVLGFRYKFGNTKIRDNSKKKNTDEGKRL